MVDTGKALAWCARNSCSIPAECFHWLYEHFRRRSEYHHGHDDKLFPAKGARAPDLLYENRVVMIRFHDLPLSLDSNILTNAAVGAMPVGGIIVC